jgi:hypothetical protein
MFSISILFVIIISSYKYILIFMCVWLSLLPRCLVFVMSEESSCENVINISNSLQENTTIKATGGAVVSDVSESSEHDPVVEQGKKVALKEYVVKKWMVDIIASLSQGGDNYRPKLQLIQSRRTVFKASHGKTKCDQLLSFCSSQSSNTGEVSSSFTWNSNSGIEVIGLEFTGEDEDNERILSDILTANNNKEGFLWGICDLVNQQSATELFFDEWREKI